MKIDTFLKVARALSKFSLSNKVATIFHFFTPLFYSLFSLHFITPLFHCQRSCLSHGRDQQLCILFAGLCCLSAGRDKASISDKKCDRPRGEGAERRQPTVCILGAEAKALSADNECMLSAQLSVSRKRPAAMHFSC